MTAPPPNPGDAAKDKARLEQIDKHKDSAQNLTAGLKANGNPED